MRYFSVKAAAIAALSALSLGTANAATISSTYAVVGSNFISTSVSPYASITESVTVTFNNALVVSQQTNGISLNASTITPTSPLAYTYVPGTDTLIIGGTAATVTTADPTSTDFALIIRNASNVNFSITSLSYTIGSGATFLAGTTSKAVAAVPEPASMALLGAGIGTLAFARRRRIKC